MLDVENSETKGMIIRGVKGRSSFCDFPNVDMIRSFNLDSMHNGILGVAEQMWILLKTRMTPLERKHINDLLMSI